MELLVSNLKCYLIRIRASEPRRLGDRHQHLPVDREGRAVAADDVVPHRPGAVVLAGAEHGDDIAGAVGVSEGKQGRTC